MIGAFRTWRVQNAVARGKVITGGFEIILLAGGMLLVSIFELLAFTQDNA
jgi:hypothetical protein